MYSSLIITHNFFHFFHLLCTSTAHLHTHTPWAGPVLFLPFTMRFSRGWCVHGLRSKAKLDNTFDMSWVIGCTGTQYGKLSSPLLCGHSSSERQYGRGGWSPFFPCAALLSQIAPWHAWEDSSSTARMTCLLGLQYIGLIPHGLMRAKPAWYSGYEWQTVIWRHRLG